MLLLALFAFGRVLRGGLGFLGCVLRRPLRAEVAQVSVMEGVAEAERQQREQEAEAGELDAMRQKHVVVVRKL